MTAAVSDVASQIASIQATLQALSYQPASTTSSAEFAQQLADATGSSTGTTGTATAGTTEPTTGTNPATTDPTTTDPTTTDPVTTPTDPTTTPTDPTAPTGGTTGTGGTVTGSDIVADAKQYLGIPYVWGGESTSGLDCSGLVQKTMTDLGITVPRVAADQQKVGTPVASLSEAQPGDLLFFGRPAYHVAIYLGNNQLIESPEPGKTVHITDVYQTPTSISRVVSPSATTAPADPSGSSTAGLTSAQLTAAGIYPAVASYATQFAQAESTYHLPAGLLAAVCQQESGGNASAVSPAGAQGLMQLMPSTAASYGADPFDPAQAITAAAKIFSQNLGQFHQSVPLALAAYNAGAGAVQQYGGIPPYSETQNYVQKITATMAAGG